MADYDTVIAQAVEGLDQNTSRTRRALYERARAAQVKHLRAIHPPLGHCQDVIAAKPTRINSPTTVDISFSMASSMASAREKT
jgi:hypothetical protein